ncbi:hypothetical protein ACI6QG_02155 [Roseococcus sp. DSY-14]|uniref:hypothetical protein n=1 Tax=Roseococcus sp. DSY-14 TaxID=3369650 RepID=UPI00387B7DA3
MTNATIFADGLVEASVQHGVVRLTLGQVQADGAPRPAGQLCVPVVQMAALARSLAAVVAQIEARARPAAAPPAAEAALPGAFTFGDRP